MRKDPSNLVTEFIQGGSHGDGTNTNVVIHTNINSVENLTVGNCDSTNNSHTPKSRNLDFTKEQRDEASLIVDSDAESSTSSFPHLDCVSFTSATAAVEEANATSSETCTKSVRFGNCSIRSYNQILGDHPLCAVGCPITLGWRVVNQECYTVEDHEALREPLRKKKQTGKKRRNEPIAPKFMNAHLRLSAYERRDRLRNYSDAQIRLEWSRMKKQAKRGLVKEGLRQFRAAGMHYAGF